MRDAALTLPLAFTSTRVPLGLPALSVSILIITGTDGLPVLARLSLSVVPATPLPNTGKETRVLAVTSPIFCAEVACAVVGAFSMKTALPAERVSQAGYEVLGKYSGFTRKRGSSSVTKGLLALGVHSVPTRASFSVCDGSRVSLLPTATGVVFTAVCTPLCDPLVATALHP